jgi:hemoglobin
MRHLDSRDARPAACRARDSAAQPARGKDDEQTMEHPDTLYEHAGGEPALHRLEELFYDKVLADPVLQVQFRERVPTHVDHLTWFTAESFGGSDRFSRELGFQRIIDVHRHLDITDEQRERFVALYLQTLKQAGLPRDQPFLEAVRSHLEFGSRVAQQNSRAQTDADLHPIRHVPHWTWPD